MVQSSISDMSVLIIIRSVYTVIALVPRTPSTPAARYLSVFSGVASVFSCKLQRDVPSPTGSRD